MLTPFFFGVFLIVLFADREENELHVWLFMAEMSDFVAECLPPRVIVLLRHWPMCCVDDSIKTLSL